jgi:hypothetical protein
MLVANDVMGDSRVQKTALSIEGAGCRFSVLGLSPTSERTESMLGKVRVILVPVVPLRSKLERHTQLLIPPSYIEAMHRYRRICAERIERIEEIRQRISPGNHTMYWTPVFPSHSPRIAE